MGREQGEVGSSACKASARSRELEDGRIVDGHGFDVRSSDRELRSY
jgi:hypothetical protein